MDDTGNTWQLDKRVPITVVVLLIVNMVGGVWYVSGVENRLSNLEEFKQANQALDSTVKILNVRMGSIEQSLRRIENAIDKEYQQRDRRGD